MEYLTYIGAAFVVWFVLVLLFAPHIPYKLDAPIDLSSDHFLRMIEAACQAAYKPGNRFEIMTNGPAFYPEMLEAIRQARETVNMEVYMFKRASRYHMSRWYGSTRQPDGRSRPAIYL